MVDKTLKIICIFAIIMMIYNSKQSIIKELFNENDSNSNSVVNLSKNTQYDNIVKNKLITLVEAYGEPSRVETTNNGKTLYKATWLNIENCDEITIHEDIYNKYHPHKAIVFVIARKLIHVPDHLLGPLKYASETINIEQIQTTKEISKKYYDTGKKEKAMVTGSCASIIISVITLDFIIDMVNKYRNFVRISDNLRSEFRNEYNKRVHEYLVGNKVIVSWFNHKNSVEYKGLKEDVTYMQLKKPFIAENTQILF